MSKITDTLGRIFARNPKDRVIRDNYSNYATWAGITCLPFGEVVFRNIMEILTDLVHDVTLQPTAKADLLDFNLFKKFIETEGRTVLNRYFVDGFVVIGLPHGNFSTFTILNQNEYNVSTTGSEWRVTPTNGLSPENIYVITSETFRDLGESDRRFLDSYIRFLDNVLNASNTVSERLGNVIVASPKNLSSAPTSIVLDEEEKKKIETEMSENYGSLSRQKQVMLLPREMNFQQLSLTSIDQRTEMKVRLAVEVIADRLRVPACKIALIDANSSKALANGSEQMAGDILLYKSFERLFESTFIKMANDLKMPCTYTIYGKPEDTSGATLTQTEQKTL